MKIALYQGPSPQGDIERAFNTIEQTLASAAKAGAKMLLFPELFLPGYNQPELHKAMAQPQKGPWEKRLAKLAKLYKTGLAIGWAEQDAQNHDAIYNAASCFDEAGNKIAHYQKIQLFGPVEKATFRQGTRYEIFPFNGYKTSLLICYDVEFAHHVQALREQGVELLLVPTANAELYDNVPSYIVPARAAENRMIIAYANYCGQEKNILYGGKSLIAGPDAVPLAKACKGETILMADLNIISKIDTSLLSTQDKDRIIITP